jgi:hypothetical protein
MEVNNTPLLATGLHAMHFGCAGAFRTPGERPVKGDKGRIRRSASDRPQSVAEPKN